MTLTAENITKTPIRGIAVKMATMSCLGYTIWFNKPAARLLGAPCRISFSDEIGKWMILKSDNLDAFEIKNKRDRFIIQKKSRALTANLEKIFDCIQPKFQIKATGDPNIFELILLEK